MGPFELRSKWEVYKVAPSHFVRGGGNTNVIKMTYEKEIKKAGIGKIVPCVRVLHSEGNALELFSKLSDYGRKQHSVMLESADVIKKYGEQSVGTADPCLRVYGRKERFEIEALNKLGERFLEFIKDDFSFADSAKYEKTKITGILKPARGTVSEEERLTLKTHADVLRTIAFKFTPTKKPFTPYSGLFGAISYDFIDQFEDLPKNKSDTLKDPDYELYFADNLFMVNHPENKIYFIANALVMDQNYEEEAKRCEEILNKYESILNSTTIPKTTPSKPSKAKTQTDTPKEEYMNMVKALKKHILAGDIFQIVPSRMISRKYAAEPLDIYAKLRELNPSPYMFYINSPAGILLGASPEMFLSVKGQSEKRVEIRPIAGTKPRGIVDGKINKELDSRYEAELKIDEKELAEHTMLIDLARNDVARVSKPGTRTVEKPFHVEKYSHVQHLVSNVIGTLKDEYDCLHAYLASMNMGTLTGAPKVEAMKLIRKYEKTRRGFYGGSVIYITPSGELDSAIVIRTARLKNGKAYIRAGGGIVYDSVPETEFNETSNKARACLKAIELAEVNEEKDKKTKEEPKKEESK